MVSTTPLSTRCARSPCAFFRQPAEAKRLAAVNARHRGFNALGDALMYEARKPDHKEFFSMGLDLPEDDPDVLAGEKLRGPNNWPPDNAGIPRGDGGVLRRRGRVRR